MPADTGRRLPSRGMTLIELIVFIVIVSVGLTGVLAALNTAVKGSADPLQPKQALVIAEGLLEEILLKSYNNPTGGYTPTTCAGTNPSTDSATCKRSLFDDILDYTGFTVSPVTGYKATVTISAENTAIGVTARLVTVSVSTPAGSPVSLSGYRANY